MKKIYTAPEAGIVPICFEDCLFTVTSGYDQFHQGGGGFYGDNDINDNPFIF